MKLEIINYNRVIVIIIIIINILKDFSLFLEDFLFLFLGEGGRLIIFLAW